MITDNTALIVSNVWLIGATNSPSTIVRLGCLAGAALWFVIYLVTVYENRRGAAQ